MLITSNALTDLDLGKWTSFGTDSLSVLSSKVVATDLRCRRTVSDVKPPNNLTESANDCGFATLVEAGATEG